MSLQPPQTLVAFSLQQGHYVWVGKGASCDRPNLAAIVVDVMDYQ